MQHKHIEHELFNTINYMSAQFLPEFTFFGFIPVKDEYFGVMAGDVHLAAIHISDTTVNKVMSDDEAKEEKQLRNGKRWLAVIYGSDNSSFMKRFDSKERMLKWLYKSNELTRDDSWLWYNS